jgi:uncharacterized protein DUF4157
MPSKELSHKKETDNSRRRSPSSGGERRRLPTRLQTDPAAVYRLARRDVGSLSPRDVLQLQRSVGNRAVTQLLAGTARRRASQKESSNGLPDGLKAGVENLSGVSLDVVKVHYNSARPAQLRALAYTQGADIHVAPGQEKHLPHEVWHAVQQMQGRVRPSMQIEGGVYVSDDAGLEREADVMSAKALRLPHSVQDATESQPVTTSFTHVGSTAPVQRVIDPQKQEYVINGQRVTGPAGAGTIVEAVGEGYTVRFDADVTFYVPANALDLLESREEADLENKAEVEEADYKPVKLVVHQGKGNSWDLELQNAGGKTLGIAQGLKQNDVKVYIVGNKAIIAQPQAKVKAGTFNLKPEGGLKGSLKQAYDKFMEAEEQAARLAKLRATRVNTQVTAGRAISQKEILDRLNALQGARKLKEEGHPSIQMTKIALDRPVKLKVGGQERDITHLYTQPGNQTERRCYLGNKDGAYQRVHTSITDDDEMTAHTMIQTGRTVAVPPIRGGGTRIGFDTKEEKGEGFAARDLKVRSKEQSTVAGYIAGQTPKDLEEAALKGALLLASRFNAVLDEVFADISRGAPKEREVEGITSDFKILDDEWTFESNTATPEEELADEQEATSLPPLLATPFISSDEDINDSVREYPGVDEVLKRYDITFVSGRNWLCFIRSILLDLGKDNATLVELYKLLRQRGLDLTELERAGVETGTPLAGAILAAIADITGQQVRITLVIPKTGAPPETGAGSIGGGKEVFLLHTHIHFSLVKPKNV